jgi:dephospho-CoA kinase
VTRRREALIAEARSRGDRVVIADIPLLFEAGLDDEVDTIVLVDAPSEMRRARLLRDRGLSEPQAEAMIAAQMPASLKRARADHLIENTGTLDALASRTDEVWDALSRDPRAQAESP